MPPAASHPQAKFDPIPPDLNLHELVQNTPNFEWATQISASEIYALGQQRFEKLVAIHVINGGKPLVIKNWNERLSKDLFSVKWLEDTYNRKVEQVWDINNKSAIPMTMGHYLRSMKLLTDQWTPHNFRDERRQRLYLKDIDCPPEWLEKLAKVLPRSIFYLNEDIEGGQSTDRDQDGDDMFVHDRPVARAGDLMSSLPPAMRAENLMCYIGHEGTYTPAHREMCASLGQNIMVDASGSDNGEKPGSSIWFMTETKDREVVGEYFLSMLGHDVEIEKHFAQINAWKKATFPVYMVEQKPGDLILVPPLAPHQVWNRGTRTIKVAWNRTVVETLELALREALPKARLVCRDEQYKNKAIVYYTLKKYYTELAYAQAGRQLDTFGISQDVTRDAMATARVADDFKRLLRLYTDMLVDEMFVVQEKSVEFVPFDSNITCSYCRANIFNKFLTCKHCVRPLADGEEDTYDVCMECYAMGRSCMCVSGLSWCEQWPWDELVGNYDLWQAMVVSNDGYIDAYTSPGPLEVARLRAGRKPVAQICQEQLRRRPFRDITQPVVEEPLEPSDPEVDDNGIAVKKGKKRGHSRKKKGDTYRCHVCCHKDHRYRLAFCTTPGCNEAYCYGVLYRGFDMMPQTVMQQAYWKCPRCTKICNCGLCRRLGLGTPYVPKATLLGHDTRPIADDRSVESLINFRLHNLMWLKNSGDESRNIASKRLQNLRQQADAAKAQDSGVLGEGFGSAGGDAGARGDADAHANGAHGLLSHDDGINPALFDTSHGGAHDDSVYPDLLSPHGGSGYSNAAAMLGDETAPTAFGQAYYMDDGDDDSANKILFDPYQEPPPNPMVGSFGSMTTLPEFLESYTHKAVRRPRHEKDDDPDYQGPKPPRYKKTAGHAAAAAAAAAASTAAASADPDMNVDPALLRAVPGPPVRVSARASAPVDSMQAVEDAHHASLDQRTDGAGETVAGKHFYPANVPRLRHARPKASYLEDNVASDGELDEDGSRKTARQQAEPPAATGLDGIVKTVEPVEPVAEPVAETVEAGTVETEAAEPRATAAAAEKENEKPTGPSRKRARLAETAAPSRTPVSPPTASMPAKRLRTSAATASSAAPRVDCYGRSTASAPRAGGHAAAHSESSVSSESEVSESVSSESDAARRESSRRRQAVKTKTAAKSVSAKPTNTKAAKTAAPADTPPPTQFLSMAERMALRGKKFKMAAAKAKAERAREEQAKAKEKEKAASAAARPKPPKRKEPVAKAAADTDSSDSEGFPSRRRPGASVASRGASSSAGRGAFRPTRGGASRSAPRATVVRLAESSSASESLASSARSESGSSDDAAFKRPPRRIRRR